MKASEKLERLKEILSESGSAVIALSGGTDSTFLVSVAATLPGLRVMAVTVSTPYMFSSEVEEASRFCSDNGVRHMVIRFEIPATVITNPPDRCYLCKREVMGRVTAAAAEGGYAFVFDGTNADDLLDYRPGLKALTEAGVRSPLAEAGLEKEEIRGLARAAGLAVSDRPSNTCLLTRFPHDTVIDPADLRRAEEAEMIVREAGFTGARVRVHGDLARIELRNEHFLLITDQDIRTSLSVSLRSLGYRYITFDAEGYRSGSMNKTTGS
ncbi:MAG: ATP-dependent sacrificial sulfur transferase LarE [Bacteroidetes bacterium]|nr:MAG: ATP-dependent sacrificial sulfur transferase LarE [Bacteroidota bacterium]